MKLQRVFPFSSSSDTYPILSIEQMASSSPGISFVFARRYIAIVVVSLFILTFCFIQTSDYGISYRPQGWNPMLLKKVTNKSNAIFNYYQRRQETRNLDCRRALNNDKEYFKWYSDSTNRITIKDAPVSMNCSAIKARVLPKMPQRQLKWGVAFARIVYADYHFIEDELRSQYHPDNYFCFAIDKKAKKEFHDKIKALAACFPNVLITPEEYSIDSAGHNMNAAHFGCMRILNEKETWNYVILLQNHDIITKSIYELETIYDALGGANDVELTPCPEGRVNKSMRWDAQGLNLFTKNDSRVSPSQLTGKLEFSKGAVQASVSREAVRWMFDVANMTQLLWQINQMSFGVDEVLMQSLQISDSLDMPGRFTSYCLSEKNKNTDFISRMSHWEYGSHEKCATNKTRHAICLLGLEDLSSIALYPNVMANKFLPDFDYGGIECLHELLYNRTYLGQEDSPLDMDYYNNMVNVKYHKARMSGKPLKNEEIECEPKKVFFSFVKYP